MSDPHAAYATAPRVTLIDGEVVIAGNLSGSLTREAALELARRLLEAADRPDEAPAGRAHPTKA